MNTSTPILAETLLQLTQSEWTTKLHARAEKITIVRVEKVGENLRDTDGHYSAYRLVDTATGKVFTKASRQSSCCWYDDDDDDDFGSSNDKSKKLIIVRGGEALERNDIVDHLQYEVGVKVLGRPADFAEAIVAKVDADKKAREVSDAMYKMGNAFTAIASVMPRSVGVVGLLN